MRMMRSILLFFASSLLAQDADLWGDDAWNEETSHSQWQWSGFTSIGFGYRLSSDPLFNKQETLSEWRFHSELEYDHEQFDFQVEADVWYDDVLNKTEFDLRQLTVDFSLGSRTDVTLGQQVSTWGTGDLLFLNDFFPKDWQSFFAGREVNYLKAPAAALRMRHYFQLVNVDWVLTPEFVADRYINGERFSFYNPQWQQSLGGKKVIRANEPSQPEFSLRLFKQLAGWEYAVYGYRGYEKSPVGFDVLGSPTYHRKQNIGLSVRGSVWGGLLNIEVAHHEALDDKQGDDPLVANGQNRWLLGYEHELIKKLNWSMQYYVEQTHDVYAARELAGWQGAEHREVWTQRLTYLSYQDKLTWSLFVFYSPTDEDSYWRPNIQYRHNDHWLFDVGSNVFRGSHEQSFFGQFDRASNAYINVKYQF